MNNITIVFIGVALVLISGSEFIRRRSLDNLLKKIYKAAYQDHDEQAFYLYINSPQAKMVMSDSSRDIIKLNYYIATDNDEKVMQIIERLRKKRMDRKSLKSFYSAAIGYCGEHRKAITVELLNEMKSNFQDSKAIEDQMLLLDAQMIYDIYIRHDTTKIQGLKKLVEATPDENAKSIYLYRLAILYKANNDFDSATKVLNQAKEYSTDPNAIMKIQRILNQNLEEL